jgi:hypothetical protein
MRNSSTIREEIGNLAPSYQATYRRAQALRKLIIERSRPLLFELTAHRGSERLNDPGDAEGYAFNLAGTPLCQQVVGLVFMRDMLEASEDYKEAAALMEPLEAELSEALAHEQKQREIEAQLEAKVAEALELAEARAKEAAAKDKMLIAARAELEKATGRALTTAEIEAATPREPTALESYHGTGKIHPEPANA